MMCAAAAVSSQAVSAPESVLTVTLPQGGSAPALGMGSWHLAQGRHPLAEEEEALRTGLSLGMTLIDTAEIYGNGAAETMIGKVIAGQRDSVFLVSKVAPYHAMSADDIRRACRGSLARLGTHYLDLYLLHWRGRVRLDLVVSTFDALCREGLIRRWGVSNFEVSDMEDLFRVSGGKACTTDQVRYNLGDRSIEGGDPARALLAWSILNDVPLMAYSPLGSGDGLLRKPVLSQIAARHGVSPAAVAIAWTLRNGRTISIPESGSVAHTRQNAAALRLALTEQDLIELDNAFPG